MISDVQLKPGERAVWPRYPLPPKLVACRCDISRITVSLPRPRGSLCSLCLTPNQRLEIQSRKSKGTHRSNLKNHEHSNQTSQI